MTDSVLDFSGKIADAATVLVIGVGLCSATVALGQARPHVIVIGSYLTA